ncbi:MAG: hypothetical protein IT458_03055 [Planctomycetes bacterium]|nr:hypothetical protein [Planctomycetota bacterium]
MTPSERNFHLLMAGLVFVSTVLDDAVRDALSFWKPPPVSLVTLTLGLVWVGLHAARRSAEAQERLRDVEGRLDAAERRAAALEEEVRARRRPGVGP